MDAVGWRIPWKTYRWAESCTEYCSGENFNNLPLSFYLGHGIPFASTEVNWYHCSDINSLLCTGALDTRSWTRERMRRRSPTKMTFLTTWPSWGETGNSKYIFSTVFPNNGPDGTKQVVKVWRSYLIYYTYNTYNSCPSLTGRAWADWGRWRTQWSASTAERGSLTKAAGKRSWTRSSAPLPKVIFARFLIGKSHQTMY